MSLTQEQADEMVKGLATVIKAKKLVARLHALLEKPHPGLHSWCMAYGRAMQNLSDFWNKGADSVQV